ncbi:hypothetical protein GCM10007103_19570 [Salinimicrobium marinum]|uniref:Uncharacterized protein n=1 Tax=Salinimicrobium marinum TaxID=680283 RepID=A0A918VYZ8_9FLAO|nr:hypothetical protein [Salinimicrobium marinum]GHA38287.1 hypothetical protein GCM10007103_19570 [Salinimicrobium marinum]
MINYGLKYKVSEISKILKVEKKLVKDWIYHFAEYLSSNANPEKGKERQFTTEDICTLGYISFYWEEEPDLENIKWGLNGGCQFESPFAELATEAMPVFLEFSEEILSKNVWMIGGMVGDQDILSLANSYKEAGDILVNIGINDETNKEIIYPAIYNYRHSIELYLKAILSEYKKTHKLKTLYLNFKNLIKENYQEEIPIWFENVILAFDEFDPEGTYLRYGNSLYNDELYINLPHLKLQIDWFSKSINRIEKNKQMSC